MGEYSYEARVMDLHDAGMCDLDIAVQTGFSLNTVRGVIARLNIGSGADEWTRSARLGSEALFRAIRRHHPDRCGS